MKKSVLLFASLAVLASCKKENSNDITPTDTTGNGTLKGTITKNIILHNGNGSYNPNALAPAANVKITVKVNKNALYPASNAAGADVYSTTTDAKGFYSLDIKTNANGVNALVTIEGYSGTMDTIINGQTRSGLLTNYFGTQQNRQVYIGQSTQFDYQLSSSTIGSNPNYIYQIGTGIVTGSVAVNQYKQVQTGTLVTLTSTNIPLANHKVYLTFNKDPQTLATKYYEATTDGNGVYSFNISTVMSGTSGFNQNATVWVADYSTTQDTITPTNTVKTGKAGVFQSISYGVNGIYNNSVKNANNFVYNNFVQN